MAFSNVTVSVEVDGPAGSAASAESTRMDGRVVVRVHGRALTTGGVTVAFFGTETVYVRAWAGLAPSSVRREIVRASTHVHPACTLAPGVHTFAFCVLVPWWVPSSVADGDQCQIRYALQADVAGHGASDEVELECRRIRVSRRLARRKRLEQSVGCPDGSCHVRFSGSLSRDVVRPGAQVRVDVVARTSDARFGVRALVAHVAEHLVCHVQARGEQRLTRRIAGLTSVRMDGLAQAPDGPPPGSADSPAPRPVGLRKTRSRLAELLQRPSPPPPPAVASAGHREAVVRQVRASQTLHVPRGLSQFSSEYVSREYRVTLVAEVAPLADALAESEHVFHGAAADEHGGRLSAESADGDSDGAAGQRLGVAERSSAIATWPIDVVDHFDVQFDELVGSAQHRVESRRPATALREPEVLAGRYAYAPPSAASPLPASPALTLTPAEHAADEGQRPGHHRRTSSGLVGFLMRGFRSSSGSLSPHAESCGAEVPAQQPRQRHVAQHARSASSGCEYLHVPPPAHHHHQQQTAAAARLVRRRGRQDHRDHRDHHDHRGAAHEGPASSAGSSRRSCGAASTASSGGGSSAGSAIVMRPLTGHGHGFHGFFGHRSPPASAPAAADPPDPQSSAPRPGAVLRRRQHHP
ncbi:hypothetical protein GGI15_003365 [Coemansia interrupta]|uniref:Arrestin-like N-terminal domain-containing protein n=1 Tax=Coemansia interrupta TaxID=1126814 RepID=A0A9W8H9Z9_9FUNG|nr:hypothetical protein GGI15_003365 [Coemansia interrupta]